MTARTAHWADHAECQGTADDLWFPSAATAATSYPAAQRICARCPVWDQCLDEDLTTSAIGARYGIRAGLSPSDRDDIARGARPRPTEPPEPPATPTTAKPYEGEPAVSVTELETPAGAHAVPTTAEELIAWGAAHASTRVQALSARASAALTDLRKTVERESAVASAEARVQRLKAQLANAENDLRAAKGSPTKTTTQTASKDGRDYPAIRAWARENGHQVGSVGRPSRAVLDAYDAAHAQDAA